jgi:hypothetical protein
MNKKKFIGTTRKKTLFQQVFHFLLLLLLTGLTAFGFHNLKLASA